ncbi:WD domain-containing protein 23 [Elsinoe fawcettii]|nr:WD domain-containing protein 23 [Elsinoe fawcettii]
MRAFPLLVRWHNDNAPIYSAAFETGPKGRLATAGGDNHVRLWKIEGSDDDRKVTFLSTLEKHTQAVNVVRWCPKGEMLATAGDDGNVLLWIPSDHSTANNLSDDAADAKETWRVKTMCRSPTGAEIYDLAWSPDGAFFITGSMDNVARIYDTSGTIVRQVAEAHTHYVQGVAWDPLNEYIATQSSDRSVHIFTLKSKDGQPSLTTHNKITKMEMPSRRVSSNSPAPPEFRGRALASESIDRVIGSPVPSAPGTPQSLALPMNPPPTSHSRRSSFGSTAAHSIRRSVSPSPSLPLPAVMPAASPGISGGLPMTGYKNTNLYANETFTSFFRRLTFAPDGSLLFTPAGQQKEQHHHHGDKSEDINNMTYIYTRAGLNKPPVAKLPGHKKPSLAVRCSPIYYTLRNGQAKTREITIDTGNEGDLSPLPEPVVESKAPISQTTMDPPPPMSAPSPAQSSTTAPSPRHIDPEPSPMSNSHGGLPAGPPPVFDLPYRMVYAVATQDAVYVYDTQQKQPLCVVSNLHYATFTDLSWTSDGSMLLITSSDGFCSCLTFAPGELGTVHHQPAAPRQLPSQIMTAASPGAGVSTPSQTPTQSTAPPLPRPASSQSQPAGQSPFVPAHPASPARSMSISSVTTQELTQSLADQTHEARAASSLTPQISSMPSTVAASGASAGGLPMFTPPQTPGSSMVTATSVPSSMFATAGIKREGEVAASGQEKRRRIAPTLISGDENAKVPPAPAPTPAQSSVPEKKE